MTASMPSKALKETNLLFGVIAVQLHYLSPVDLARAAAAWAADPEVDLGELATRLGLLKEEHRKLIQDLIEQQIEINQGDPVCALASFGGKRAVQESFAATAFGGEAEDGPEYSAISSRDLKDPARASGPKSTKAMDDDELITPEHPGRYTIRGEYGHGAIGRVLLAYDEHVGRQVALKELLPARDSAASDVAHQGTPGSKSNVATLRFLREARITGQLEHPGIVPVYEIARHPDGSLFYTMKFVRGKTLEDHMAEAKTLRDRLRLLHHFLDLCQAVAYAHSKGVVHRDIKPANVMVGEFGETVVLDWGLAKVRGLSDLRAQDLETKLETFRDSAPVETAQGEPIGTPLYMSPEQVEGLVEQIDERSDVWALGAILYQLLTAQPPFPGATVFEVMGKALSQAPVPIAELTPLAPAELAAVVEKCLQKDKDRRYAHAGELAQDIESFQSGGLVSAFDYHFPDLVRRFVRKRWYWLVLAGAVFVGSVIGAGAWIKLNRQTEKSLFLELLYMASEAKSETEREGARRSEGKIDSFLALNPDYAPGYFIRGNLDLARGAYPKAIADYNRSIELDPHYFKAYINRGIAHTRLGHPEQAIADYEMAIKSDPNHLTAHNNLGIAYYDQGEYRKAADVYSQAIALSPNYAVAYNNRGNAEFKLGEIETAINDYSKAIELDAAYATAINNRGYARQQRGELDLAISDYTQAIALDDSDASFFNNRANAFAAKGDLTRALEDYTRAIDINPKYVEALENRGGLLVRSGEFDRAIGDFHRALELAPQNHVSYRQRGLAYAGLRLIEKALRDFDRALELKPEDVDNGNELAWILATWPEDKYRDGKKAVALAQTACKATAYRNTNFLDTLAAASAENGEFDEAIKWQSQAIEILTAQNNLQAAADYRSRLALYREKRPFHQK